jgi:hypothetical protein
VERLGPPMYHGLMGRLPSASHRKGTSIRAQLRRRRHAEAGVGQGSQEEVADRPYQASGPSPTERWALRAETRTIVKPA